MNVGKMITAAMREQRADDLIELWSTTTGDEEAQDILWYWIEDQWLGYENDHILERLHHVAPGIHNLSDTTQFVDRI